MSKNDDSLFLLEVLIDKIVFVKSPCFSDKDFRTCVNIECNAVEPLEICDDDPGVGIAKSGGPFVKPFNTGKSCLFSLKESDISAAMSKFPVKVSVYKSLPCGCLPTKIIMGECMIDMTKEFVETRKNFLDDPTSVSYQALKDSFRFVGPDGEETGEIVMFLRISCFGKLIITSFQGASGGAPNLGGKSRGSSGVVDRSCAPKKDFQTTEDPCVCGAARGHGGAGGTGGHTCTGTGSAVCPPARDPYNSMPCEDPDDPCYCSGPKPPEKQKMVCRNTDQYCLHVPKGVLSSLLFYQKMADEPKNNLVTKSNVDLPSNHHNITRRLYNLSTLSSCEVGILKSLKISAKMNLLYENRSENYLEYYPSLRTQVSASGQKIHTFYTNKSLNHYINLNEYTEQKSSFGAKETIVYMTLFDDYCPHKTSGTQATALINKCFQVRSNFNTFEMNSDNCSTCTMSTLPLRESNRYEADGMHYSEIYFFGRKKEPEKGMGGKGFKTKLCKTGQPPSAACKSTDTKGRLKDQSTCSSQTKRKLGANTSTGTTKSVTIKDDKPEKPCPGVAVTKGEMMATVSHIKIGPKEPCPVHGKDPCQGPKCIIAASAEEHAPVKVTTVTNARRGVFELVIRKITGAPLAKNELLLEWTPPPSRPPPCGSTCPIPCTFPGPCRPSKCKLIVCKPSPCKPKCCKKKPCGQPCRPVPCKKCCKTSCCGKPCTSCSPFPPPPCKKPCTPPCCKLPCSSSPCLKPCPIGRRRPRRTKSQPKIKSHKKRTSPCSNRVKTCPVVKCRSMPGCCAFPPPCPPRKCCSVAPCKPPRCCRSNCSSCCI